ncbi:PhzF family phenazine biosynthesis protein [Schlesneria paludicola]|uniref:PhzF family phenazine biosynthesis protein n=1 Tax=Schlesneria paludicola TaxID=360056 RepID=UPI000299D972|nr:PhzF family phenazine biosynthesis protein [Schlesneria paludicola]
MAGIPCWQVDAFTDHAFGGNPAAVCWLEQEAETAWMQSVAAEMNLSETAFVRRLPDSMELRWFTPTIEVDLCGHATLATARVLWSEGLAPKDQPLRFQTRSGLLTCRLSGELIELDFPATPPIQIDVSQELIDALGITPLYVGRSKFYQLAIVDSPATVRAVKPDFRKLAEVPTLGVIVSAASSAPPYDFESRFFAPRMGVDEDPVCGSAHCCLTPFWSQKLGKKELLAYQASARGGILHLRWEGERVILGGQGVVVWRGECLC